MAHYVVYLVGKYLCRSKTGLVCRICYPAWSVPDLCLSPGSVMVGTPFLMPGARLDRDSCFGMRPAGRRANWLVPGITFVQTHIVTKFTYTNSKLQFV